MTRILNVIFLFLLLAANSFSQSSSSTDSLRLKYQAGQKIVSTSFSEYFYPDRDKLFSLKETDFVFKMDSLRSTHHPNLLLVNAGVYDFISDRNTDWVSHDLKDKNTVKEISPVHLSKKDYRLCC